MVSFWTVQSSCTSPIRTMPPLQRSGAPWPACGRQHLFPTFAPCTSMDLRNDTTALQPSNWRCPSLGTLFDRVFQRLQRQFPLRPHGSCSKSSTRVADRDRRAQAHYSSQSSRNLGVRLRNMYGREARGLIRKDPNGVSGEMGALHGGIRWVLTAMVGFSGLRRSIYSFFQRGADSGSSWGKSKSYSLVRTSYAFCSE